MHNSVTPALAAILNQMTLFFFFYSWSLWPHSPGGTEEHEVTLWNICIFSYTVSCTPVALLIPNHPFSSGIAGIPLLCIHRGRRSCPELVIISILLAPKLERCLTWDLKTPGWPFLSTFLDTFTSWKLIWLKQMSPQELAKKFLPLWGV